MVESATHSLEKTWQNPEHSGSPKLDFASAVGNDWSKSNPNFGDTKGGAATLEKHGFASADTLLAGFDQTSPQQKKDSSAAAEQPSPQKNNAQVSGLDGKACVEQPKGNEVPTLSPGVVDNGCTYKDDPGLKQKFDEAQKHAARINYKDNPDPKETDPDKQNPKEHHGSGVIVGKGKDECYLLTDHHVTNRPEGKVHDHLDVTMPNGQRYPAEQRADKPSKDMSVVAAKTGADTDAVCNPATIAKNGEPKYTKEGKLQNPDEERLGVGYPRNAQTPYASPGTVNQAGPLISFSNSFGNDENIQRTLVQNRANYTPGQSGGGVYNGAGELTGLMDRTTRGKQDLSYETPVSKSEVDSLVKKSHK